MPAGFQWPPGSVQLVYSRQPSEWPFPTHVGSCHALRKVPLGLPGINN